MKETDSARSLHSLERREFLELSAAYAAMFLGIGCAREQRSEDQRCDLVEVDSATLRQRMESGRESAVSLVEKYLARIDAIDRSGPRINSIIEVNPDALEIARRLDAERRVGQTRGALHGIPIVIKDNIATADRMMTTAGSLAMVGAKPRADAALVTALRAAGLAPTEALRTV